MVSLLGRGRGCRLEMLTCKRNPYTHVSITRKVNYCIYSKHSDRQTWANSVDPDQTPHFAASDQGLHCNSANSFEYINMLWLDLWILLLTPACAQQAKQRRSTLNRRCFNVMCPLGWGGGGGCAQLSTTIKVRVNIELGNWWFGLG